MQTLDYRIPPRRSPVSIAQCLLVGLPIVPAGFAFLSAINWVDEPFGSVQPRDVVLFGGAPLIALGSAVAWCVIARRRRVRWPLFVVALAWFCIIVYGTIDSLVPYFQEPWNTERLGGG